MNEINKFIEDIVYIMKNGSFYEAIGITLLSIASILICCLFFIVAIVVPWIIHPLFGLVANALVITPIVAMVYVRYFLKDDEQYEP